MSVLTRRATMAISGIEAWLCGHDTVAMKLLDQSQPTLVVTLAVVGSVEKTTKVQLECQNMISWVLRSLAAQSRNISLLATAFSCQCLS